MHTYIRTCANTPRWHVFIYTLTCTKLPLQHIWQIAKIEGMEPGGFWPAVPYLFHTGFILSNSIPRFQTLVPYLYSFAWFHTLVAYPATLSLLMRSVVCWVPGRLWREIDIGDSRQAATRGYFDLRSARQARRHWTGVRLKRNRSAGFIPGFIPVSYSFHTFLIVQRWMCVCCLRDGLREASLNYLLPKILFAH